MKILVIGGCHCYGYGLKAGQGFVQKIVAQYEREGNLVHVDYYTPYKMDKIVRLVEHLSTNLISYDLILLQIGHFELLNADRFKKIVDFKQRDFNFRVYGELNESINHPLKPINIHRFLGQGFDAFPKEKTLMSFKTSLNYLKGKVIDISQMMFMNVHHRVTEIQRIKYVRETLVEILNALSFYQDKLMILTPFPVKESTTNFLRKNGRVLFMEESMIRGIQCIDTHSTIANDMTHLLSADDCHLNELGHEIIFREIQKALTIRNKNLSNMLKVNALEEYLIFNQN